jgi:hypothetical protein
MMAMVRTRNDSLETQRMEIIVIKIITIKGFCKPVPPGYTIFLYQTRSSTKSPNTQAQIGMFKIMIGAPLEIKQVSAY